MASSKAITAHDLLRVDDDRETRYAGTRDELIATGLAHVGDLPGDPGAPVCSHTVRRDGKRFHFSVQSQLAQPRTFWVRVYKPRLPTAPDPPSQAQIERQQREDAINRAIDAGEDLGVIRRDGFYGTVWIGTKDDLIATKVCEAQHFPTKPKRTLYGEADGRAGVERWSTEAIRRGYFRHSVRLEEGARKARARHSLAEESPKLERQDGAAFADRCERWFMWSRDHLIALIAGELHDEGSARYDKATIDNVRAALDHARQLLQSATPQLMVGTETQQTKAAREDVHFRKFLSGLDPT